MNFLSSLIKKRGHALLAFALVLTATVLRTVAVFGKLSAFRYFDGRAFPLSVLFLAAGALFVFLPFVLAEYRKKVFCVYTADTATFPINIFLFVFCAVFAVSLMARTRGTYGHAVALLSGLLILLGALAFLLRFSPTLFRGMPYAAAAGALGLALYPLFLYFEKSLPLNAHEKIVEEVVFICLALWVILFVRAVIGRLSLLLFRAVSLVAVFLAGYAAIPSFLFYVCRHETLLLIPAAPLVLFALAVFAGLAAFYFISPKKDEA